MPIHEQGTITCAGNMGRQYIDDRDAEECSAREGRSEQNEIALIARLPPEILADIFVKCVPVSIRKLHNDSSWLNIARVCSRWRSVALACPELWSTVILWPPTLTLVAMERSKLAPLIVRADLSKDYALDLVSILCTYAARLGALDLRSPQHLLEPFLSNLHFESTGAAPRLQDIRIINTDNDNLGEGGMWLSSNLYDRREVLQSRKAGTRVGLRLHLECCAFPWDSAWYSQMTDFHLENINPAQCPTMETLLSILVGSPALQTLSLIYCDPTTREGFSVVLPHLSILTLKTNSPSTCTNLLTYLVFPLSAIVKVSASCVSPAEHDHNIHKTLIPRFFSFCTYDTVRIVHEANPTYVLLDTARPSWSRRLRIYAKSWAPEAVFTATKAVVSHLDAARVTTLHLHGMHGRCRDMPDVVALSNVWDLAGQRLRRVRALHLHRAAPTALLEFLLTQAVWLLGVSSWKSCLYGFYAPKSRLLCGPEGGALAHAWPQLQRLGLHDVDLGAPAADDGKPVPARADLLRALLWARREGGARICSLEFADCENVFEEDLRHLRLFADLVYDGKGRSEAVKEDPGISLRSYSLGVFQNMIECPLSLCL
ncbi:hypothetical protein B0H15DRAFT_274387 [Mycena belliarum]|uniref:F-box domain-containing protein n=1 Tax=Mycena belliarum TaxID=1033014 RepID=A0AAD6U4T4_9AGAR|nr:hypothetical protein B0H15DRAFT_274387 [Mycena belliae]